MLVACTRVCVCVGGGGCVCFEGGGSNWAGTRLLIKSPSKQKSIGVFSVIQPSVFDLVVQLHSDCPRTSFVCWRC